MTLFEIVGLYVALNSLLLAILTYRVGTVRLKEKIYLGSDDNFHLQKRIRAQGNYTEFAPIALIGLFMLASLNALPIVHISLVLVFLSGVSCTPWVWTLKMLLVRAERSV